MEEPFSGSPKASTFTFSLVDGSGDLSIRNEWLVRRGNRARYRANARNALLIVAANDALSQVKAAADYVCDGTADDVQIQAALDALPSSGGAVLLSGGTFTLAATVTVPSFATIQGQGYATKVTQGAADAVFTVQGSTGAGYTLASNAAAGAVTVVLNDASAFAAGDYVLLSRSEGTETWQELGQVASKVGNTLTMEEALLRAFTTADTATAYVMTLKRGVTICDMRLSGTGSSTHGVHLGRNLDIIIQNVYFDQMVSRGIQDGAGTVSRCLITGCTFDRPVGICIYLGVGSVHNRITDNHAINPGASFYLCQNASLNIISNNSVNHPIGTAIQLESSWGNVVESNIITGGSNDGIILRNAAANKPKSSHNIIKGNVVWGSAGDCIILTLGVGTLEIDDNLIEGNVLYSINPGGNGIITLNANRNVIKGNICKDSTTTEASGIALTGNADACVVVGNICYNNYYGIRLETTPTDCIVEGNQIEGNTNTNLYLVGLAGQRNRIRNNVFGGTADPGNGGAIAIMSGGEVALVTAGAETRTLATPSFISQELTLYCKTFVGNCVVTCATTINETGNNTITFTATGQAVKLFAVEEGSTLRWRCAIADGATLSTV